MMVHACFTLLENFVDGEWGGIDERVHSLNEAVRSPSETAQMWAEVAFPDTLEIRELYNWWQDRKYVEKRVYTDTEMLLRLVEVRDQMWT
jgi:hypothetical protein